MQYGHKEAVLKLLQLGADRSIKTKTGKTAADMAKIFKETEVIYTHICSTNVIISSLVGKKSLNPDPSQLGVMSGPGSKNSIGRF